MQHMAGLYAAPGGRRDAGFQPQCQQPMIGGVEIDFIDPPSVTIECLQLWRISIRLHRPLGGFGGTGSGAESREPIGMCLPTRGGDGSLKRNIRCEQVDVLERRRLVGNVMRFEPVAWT